MAYLDDTGLAYFWGKIKAWANSVFALLGHTHPASDVTLMTGYSKPSSGSAVAASDTLNQAVGKLEAKVDDALDDSGYVHKTGNETVAGEKKFTDMVRLEQNSPQIYYKDLSLTRGTTPQNILYRNWIHVADSAGNSITRFYGVINSDSATTTQIYTYPITNTSSDDFALFRLGYDGSGTKFMSGPSTSENRSNAGDVVTRDWIPKDTRVVHTSGNEVVNGMKWFNNKLCIYTNAIEKGVNPSTKTYYNIAFCDKNYADNTDVTGNNSTRLGLLEGNIQPDGVTSFGIHTFSNVANSGSASHVDCKYDPVRDLGYVDISPIETRAYNSTDSFIVRHLGRHRTVAPSARQNNVVFQGRDADDNALWGLYSVQETNGYSWIRLINYSNTVLTPDYSYVEVGYDDSGNAYSKTVPPRSSPVYNEIVTVGWANAKYVDLSGNQLIAGNKTFSSNVRVNNTHFIINRSDIARSSSNPQYSSYTVGVFGMHDKNDKDLARFQCVVDGSGGVVAMLAAYQLKSDSDVTINAGLSVPFNSTDYSFRPFSDNNIKIGMASRRWSVVYAGTGSINTSDRRLKTDFDAIPDEVLDAWSEADFLQFRMLDAVEEKGSAARLHSGMVAQDIQEAFARHGLDASRYGLFCHDSWDAKEALEDEQGQVLEEALPAGDRYSLRYEEALCMEAACQRRENARLKKRVADLEDRLAALELRLGSE